MRLIAVLAGIFAFCPIVLAKGMRDTLWTEQRDKIILEYNVSDNAGAITIDMSRPRIKPSQELKNACDGELNRLKTVIFDRVGDFEKVKWNGISPKAFRVPVGLSYEYTPEGYYILGESLPLSFNGRVTDKTQIELPVYIAIYEKKNRYKIYSHSLSPLIVNSKKRLNESQQKGKDSQAYGTERIAVNTLVESEADNSDITSALSSIAFIKELLEQETELPFTQSLQQELFSLRSLKSKISDKDVLDRINDVLLLCSDKERELKAAQNTAAVEAKAHEQALIEQQKQEEAIKEQKAEEKARVQEEKQQKRTLWMVIGGAILAVLTFVSNAVFKHFRDISNQKNIMQMQESFARQAESDATRRSKEIIRNKAHQMANKGRSKLRETLNGSTRPASSRQNQNNKRRSI